MTHAQDLLRGAVMHAGRGQQAEPRVVVVVVVPLEEAAAEGQRVFVAAEALREGRLVLEGLELCLGVRVVVAHMRPAVGLGHAEIGQEMSHRLGDHGRAVVGVHGQLPGPETLLGVGILEQALGEGRALALALSQQPVDHAE